MPDFAKVKTWLNSEVNGVIFMWYHAEDEEPTWWPQSIKQIESGKWRYRGRSEHHVNAHVTVSTNHFK